MSNYVKTALLMGLLIGLFVVLGDALGGQQGMVMALIFGGISNVFMYWFSDKLVLWMNGAKPIEPGELPRLHRIVSDLAAGAGIPTPKLYLMDTPIANAFATGRSPDHAAVAVTSGILDVLDDRELRGVLAHELNHVLHRDILISTIASIMAGAIMVLARMAYYAELFGGGRRDSRERGGSLIGSLALLIVAPLAATLIQLAISRSREYHADEGGAKLCGDPLALASALEKIERVAQASSGYVTVPQTTAHLFIVNPFTLQGISRLFSTHPPTEDRIERLEAMAGMPSRRRLRP